LALDLLTLANAELTARTGLVEERAGAVEATGA
jgi:hypothetical protein